MDTALAKGQNIITQHARLPRYAGHAKQSSGDPSSLSCPWSLALAIKLLNGAAARATHLKS